MKFSLLYRGPLKANGDLEEKHSLRCYFDRQLKTLWEQKPLIDYFDYIAEPPKPGVVNIIKKVGGFLFVPLVCEKLNAIADLDIIFLRPEEPGSIVTEGGDIDNRLKTLLDGLRMPKVEKEIPYGQYPPPNGKFFCLLEDDALVTHLSVTTDRLLDSTTDRSEVVLLITVAMNVTRTTYCNIGLAG